MKFYILYERNQCECRRKVPITAETLEQALQDYSGFKKQLEETWHDGHVFGLERIEQEEIVTKIL